MQLHAAVDIYDDIREAGRFYDRRLLDVMMAGLRDRGVTRVEWIVDTMWSLYDSYPGGLDLLAEAIEAAHSAGLRIDCVFKPFEAILPMFALPVSAPQPAGGRFLVDPIRGIMPVTRHFALAHPECALARKPASEPAVGDRNVTAIRLICREPHATPLDVAVTLYTSAENGTWTRYEGDLQTHQEPAWRHWMWHNRPGWSITVGGLAVPAGHRFFRLAVEGLAVPFRGPQPDMVELLDADGQVLPHLPGSSVGTKMMRMLALPEMQGLVSYAAHPDVQAYLADDVALEAAAGGFCLYGVATRGNADVDLRAAGELVMARGREAYVPGLMHPMYPEVRASWLETVQACLDRGADGVNIRATTHVGPVDSRYWGYNDAAGLSHAEVEARNATAYTDFLREVAAACHAAGREMGVHVIGNSIEPTDQGYGLELMTAFSSQWETWVHEIADYVEMRGAMGMRRDTMQRIIDRLGAVCRAAGKPLIFQGNRRAVLPPGPFRMLETELEWVHRHPDVSAYQLYETAYFTSLDAAGELHFNAEYLDTVQQWDWA